MKHWLLLYLVLPLAVGSVAFCVNYFYSTAGPRVDASSVIDLGPHGDGSRVRFSYPIRNVGRAALELHDFKSSCGCLVTTGVRSIALAPKEEFVLTGQLFVHGGPGVKQRAVLSLLSNDPSQPEVRVEFLAEITGRIFAVPKELAMGALARGQPVRRVIEFHDQGRAKPCRLVSVLSSDPAHVRIVRFSPTDEGEEKKTSNLGKVIGICEVDILAPMEAYKVSATLQAYEADNPAEPIVTVPIHGHVSPRFEILPDTLVLPRTRNSAYSYSGTCVCRSTDRKKCVIIPESIPADLRVDVKPETDSASARLVVTWVPTGDRKPSRRTIQVRASDGEREQILLLSVTCWNPEEKP